MGVWSAHMLRCGTACSSSCTPAKAVVRLVLSASVRAAPEEEMRPGRAVPVMGGSSSGEVEEEAPSYSVRKSAPLSNATA